MLTSGAPRSRKKKILAGHTYLVFTCTTTVANIFNETDEYQAGYEGDVQTMRDRNGIRKRAFGNDELDPDLLGGW